MDTTTELRAFNQLFINYQIRFIRFANSYVRDTAAAEDFTMEALMYYWENRNNLKPDTNVPAYVLTIIKHKCLNYLQHLQTVQDTSQKMISNAEWELSTRISTLQVCEPYELFTVEIEELVNKTLDSLPLQTRKIFIMSRYQNKSHKEIAEMLNMSTKNVEFHVSKSIKALRISLKDYLPVLVFFL
jgi:RNA polymerase sigma-70 factor (ECF subfamily)